MNVLRQLRLFALLEGASYLLLLGVAMPLKYVAGWPMAVRITGSIHGILFLLFMSALFRVADEHEWPLRKSLLAFLWSLIPFGMVPLDRMVRQALQIADSGRVPGAAAREDTP
jgi:integral membrane protein